MVCDVVVHMHTVCVASCGCQLRVLEVIRVSEKVGQITNEKSRHAHFVVKHWMEIIAKS